jgi:23S rRNA (adenine2503-C2)-methyltransferase
VRLLKGIPAKINLIPFNPWPGTKYECSSFQRIEQFSDIVFRAGYASPIRTPRGRDILAACGQLKSETEKLRARTRMMLEAEARPGSARPPRRASAPLRRQDLDRKAPKSPAKV